MSRTRFDSMECSIAQSLDQIGDWWSLLIVRDAMRGMRRFGEFHESLGISRNILTQRLGRLVEQGVLERRDVGQHGTHWEYRLTAKGRDLFPVIIALLQWGDKWIYFGENLPVVMRDRATGRPVAPVRVTDADGRPLELRDVNLSQRPEED
jgi:DNA-binding HxlR family transcriptional regulator